MFFYSGLMLVGCSPSRMGVQAALTLLESWVLAMQEERDPELGKQAILANLKILLSDKIKKATDGNVALRFYLGGVSEGEKDVIREMRIGQLQVAGFK